MLRLIAFFLEHRGRRRGIVRLLWVLSAFALIVVLYSVLFHLLMLDEGRYFSWFDGGVLDPDHDVHHRLRRHHLRQPFPGGSSPRWCSSAAPSSC